MIKYLIFISYLVRFMPKANMISTFQFFYLNSIGHFISTILLVLLLHLTPISFVQRTTFKCPFLAALIAVKLLMTIPCSLRYLRICNWPLMEAYLLTSP